MYFVVILDLSGLGGVAAILRFPMPELDNLSLSDDDDDENSEMEFALWMSFGGRLLIKPFICLLLFVFL